MVDFRDKKKFKTSKALLPVDPGLPAGRYRFRLTVADDQGNVSSPALLDLEIVDGPRLPDPRLVDPVTRDPRLPISPVTPVTPVVPISPVVPRRR